MRILQVLCRAACGKHAYLRPERGIFFWKVCVFTCASKLEYFETFAYSREKVSAERATRLDRCNYRWKRGFGNRGFYSRSGLVFRFGDPFFDKSYVYFRGNLVGVFFSYAYLRSLRRPGWRNVNFSMCILTFFLTFFFNSVFTLASPPRGMDISIFCVRIARPKND